MKVTPCRLLPTFLCTIVAALLALGAPAAALGAGSQLVFSTYLGGAFKYGDIGNGIAVDSERNVYVTGRSYYSAFPVTPGAFQTVPHNVGPFDTVAFVSKFDPTGSRLIYSTYLSGEGGETSGEGIAVDSAGDAYVSGYTNSKGFPTTPGALRSSGSGGFVTKLNPSGSGIVYSTLIGDEKSHAGAIAVDPGGDAYVAAGAVTKLDPSGGLVYSNSFGGAASATDVAVDSAGNAYVAGAASQGFQATPGAFQATGQGAFAAKLDPSGSGFVYSTLLGSPKQGAGGIAVDRSGNAYIAGAAVVKLSPSGDALLYSNSVRGAGGADVAVDAAGDAFVTGTTSAPHFRTTPGALQRRTLTSRLHRSAPYLSELNPAGSGLAYSTYLGGGGDFASALAVSPAGHAYVTGGTISGTLPVSPGAFQRHPHESDGYAAFVTALDPSGQLVPGLSVKAIERRGNRIRLRGLIDPAASGELLAGVSHGRSRSATRLRRHKGGFVLASGPLAANRSWTIAIAFQAGGPWESETLCRRIQIGAQAPHRWTRLKARRCG